MYQADRGNYKTNESIGQQFTHSCLGRLIILGAIAAILAIIASFTVPGEQKMKREMIDNIRQCILVNDSVNTDEFDDFFNNISFIFTHAKKEIDPEAKANFYKLNTLHYYKHALYSTMYINNSIHPMGERIGIGMFGIVIPTVSYKDLLLYIAPVHDGYNKVINTPSGDEYFGDNPHLRPYHYKGNPED
jgi:hypothetical protein